MSDWINLDIGNIPSDFFVNERYEIYMGDIKQLSDEQLLRGRV